MSSMSRGKAGKAAKDYKVVKPKKSTKHTTPHTRNHRFKSFNDRIGCLKIDPVRRRRYVEGEEKEPESTHTYFGTSLEQWQDTNLSATFTSFAKEVLPLCDNLAVVLYNQEKIMDVLVKYIEKADALAMEPLLNLLSQFAHDLDTKFEAHFQRAVATVTAVAAQHSDFAVIEWSFTCLAWLFKYLSRLLTPDLRPLYDLMAPYLGKEAQKPFVVRFTAEALSFLVRKAALVYEKDKKPLDMIMEHMLQDCAAATSGTTASLQQQGVMTLLTEAIKGIQHGLHASAGAILSSLFRTAGELVTAEHQSMEKITTGILTSLIHSCDPEGFRPALDTLRAYVEIEPRVSATDIRFRASLLFTVVSVRKGTRVQDWKPIMKLAQQLVAQCGELEVIEAHLVSPVLGLVAVSMQTATIDAVLSAREVVDTIRSGTLAPHFVQFCDTFSRLGGERFQHFVQPAYQKFVLDAAQDGDLGLYSLIPRIASSGTQGFKLKCPKAMIKRILDDLNHLSRGTTSDAKEMLELANLKLNALTCLVLSEDTKQALSFSLLGLVQTALEMTEPTSTSFRDFALGTGFEQFLHLCEDETALESLWTKLCGASQGCASLPKFWSNLVRYMKRCKPTDLHPSHLETLENTLISCLASSSHSIRQDSLHIVTMLYGLRNEEAPNLLSIAVTIESIPITIETERSMSMNIRRLAPAYSLCNDDFLLRAIPTYCFGLLHLRLSKAWDDATTALAAIADTKAGEEAIMDMVQHWLDTRPDPEIGEDDVPAVVDVNTDGFKVFSDFECPNLAKLEAICEQVFLQPSSGLRGPAQQLSIDQRRIPTVTGNARSQALRVLNKMPQIAEKRSRMLVPMLLKWAGSADELDPDTEGGRWARKDQKALLAIFAQFGNPKVLYKSEEVYNALLSLAANGDVEIQRSALKAIMSWKNKAVTRYGEHLNNLLDEDRFREELSVFLREEDEEEEGIKSEDHTHLMPVMLRLLYGRAVSGGKEGQSGRRKAIFVALSRFGHNVLEQFLDIALSDKASEDVGLDKHFVEPRAPLRQQFGMLNMVNDMLQVLGAGLEPSATKLIQGVLSSTVSASRRLEQDDQQEEASLLRTIRSAGVQCLVKIFSTMSGRNLERYGRAIVNDLVVPRLELFTTENAQGVSGTLRLFAAWTSHSASSELLTAAEGKILRSIAELLQGQHSKDEVRIFILKEILDNLTQDDSDDLILQPHVSSFVTAIGAIIKGQPSKAVLDSSVQSFAKLAARISSGDEAADVTKTCTGLLNKPSKDVSPWTKTGLLRTLLPLVERFDVPVKDELYSALGGLFSRLRSAESRILLAQVFTTLVKDDTILAQASKACEDMNAMGTRLDEPDHERRERAFTWVYESASAMILEQWLPIVHNCLFFIRDPDDRINRSSASHALQLFIDAAAQHIDDSGWKSLLDDALYAGIEHGVKEQSELVRAEYLLVLGHLVEKLPTWQKISNMHSLTVGGDEEASFFNNILHIQQHRRLRALRRLTEEAGHLSSSNVSRILLPLLEHFVFDAAEGDSGQTLTDQAVRSIGALAAVLNPSAFRATFKRYTAYLKSKVELEKTVLRLIGAMVDGARASQALANAQDKTPDAKVPIDASVFPSSVIINEQLPPLLEYLHQKNESTVDRRMPVAVTIVKLMLALPEAEFAARLPAVLTDVSHVLRSRSQEARDETRKAFRAISSLVGPNYFSFLLKELRSALKRGYQLHVLSFTVHALLVDAKLSPGDLDECLPDLMAVIMDDIFGVTGQEKDAEEYKSGMKEVKSSKSYDTMEHLARITPIRKLGELIRPIRSLLSERLDMKSLKKIDELLTRLRKGVDENPASDSRDMLSFCWEIVSQVYQEEAAVPAAQTLVDERRKRFLIQPEAPKGVNAKAATTSYRFKLVSFALNLLRKVLRRHEDLQTSQNLAGFLPMAGDALIQGQEEVKLSAMRLLSTIMRVPIKKLDDNAPVYVKEAVAMIKGAPNMTTDSVKAALELITSVLREKRTVEVKEKDMALLLKRLKTDIDEPDRQGVIYKFLRSVLGRKVLIAEVYELMDEVGKAMITNPDRSIRESARSAYLQFVMEYPQGKDRWQKQTSFLVGNLQYQHASGRQSAMEFLHQMLAKIGDDVLTETSPRIFVSLLPVLVSDTDSNCRDMAKLLVGRIFERAGKEQLKQFLGMMDTWLKPEKKAAIKAGALQCWTVLMRSHALPQKQLESIRDKLENILSDFTDEETIEQPRLVLDALQALAALVEIAPAVGLGRDSTNLWQTLQQLPSRDSVEVQEIVATLLGKFFDDVASYSSKTEDKLAGLPLRGSGGLELGAEDMRRLRAVNLQALRAISLGSSETLTVQIIRNLVFLGRCFDANQMPSSDNVDKESDDEEDNEEDSPSTNDTALANLLRRLSSMLMADKFSVMSRTAALQAVAALINQIENIPDLQVILRPLYALTDPTVPKPPGDLYKALEDKARETMDLIQKKIGSQTYVAALAEARTEAKNRRDERRQKRRIEAVSAPEKWANGKKRKYEAKKVKIKAKGQEARGLRRGW